MAKEVTLPELLESRDARVKRQQQLLRRFCAPLVSFTVNYPGAIKQNELTARIHTAGAAALDAALDGKILHREIYCKATGDEGFWVVDWDSLALKKCTCAIEESHPFGRLFDMDVIGTDNIPVSRSQLGMPPRNCILCGGAPAACRRENRHSLAELLAYIRRLVCYRN